MHWNGEINPISLMQFLVIAFGIVRVLNRLDRLETKMDPLWRWFLTHTRPPDERD